MHGFWKLSRSLSIIVVFLLTFGGLQSARADALPMLSSQGTQIVDPAGHPVILKGCNLGNFYILESWMFGGTLQINGKAFKDGFTLRSTMVNRFGEAQTDHLFDTYRSSYITPRDFDVIKSFGFNVVRLPFDYRLLQDDQTPDKLRPDAFKWIDHALDMAEAAGVYVILDMHGVPGGQSNQDHTGQADQDHLWHDAADQDRTVALWKAIAEHCKDRSNVAAYDLINEPYGNYHEDVRPELAVLLPRIAEAVRGTGDQHIMFFPGALNGGIAFYGDPHAKQMSNIGFTEHYYPGLFGSKSTLETHAQLLGAELPAKEAYIKQINAPYFVGEFNVVLQSEDPNALMRMYYDRFAQYGWAGTMWSYKLIKPDGGASPGGWYMVTNADPLPKLEVTTCSYDDLEKMFASLASSPLAVNEALRAALTVPNFSPLPLAKYAPLPTAAPSTPQSNPSGYTSIDIGKTIAGYTAALPGDKVEVMAGGSDVNGTYDSFRFVSKPANDSATESAECRATITSFTDSNEYAKAGVMARWGDTPDAGMAMLNVFPDGTIALIARPATGAPTTETKVDAGAALPVQLRLEVVAGKATATYRTDNGAWRSAGTAVVPTESDFRIGLAVCAHTDGVLTTVKATLGDAGDAVLPSISETTQRPSGTSALTNGSFEQQGSASDLAADWNRWGDWINRETGWKPTHDGQCLIGYHHWQITGAGGSSGLWQDAKVQKGQRYTFTLFAQHDPADAGKHDAATLELRLEGITPDGPVTLNSHDFDVPKLATKDQWSRVSVSGTAISDTMRVLAVINASADPERGGAVKLDDATLTAAKDGR